MLMTRRNLAVSYSELAFLERAVNRVIEILSLKK